MLKHMLPGTNFSQLASAVALDSAAAAGMSHQQIREMMHFHQELFCMAGLDQQPLEGSTKVCLRHS
eukprot:gene7532-7742_t